MTQKIYLVLHQNSHAMFPPSENVTFEKGRQEEVSLLRYILPRGGNGPSNLA